MISAILTWVQAHVLYFLYQAASTPETGLVLSGPKLDLRHLHRFNREFWSLLQIIPDGMTTNPYHGTMVASMSIVPGLTNLPPTGRFEAMLESLALHPLLHLCYVICVCTFMSLMLWSSELRSGLYTELSLTIHKVTKLIKRLPASMMIKLLMFVLSPKMIYGEGALILMANLLQAYTPTDSHPWVHHLSQASAASDSVPNSIIPIILVVILILAVRYLFHLRAEIEVLKAKLKASESGTKQLLSQAQHDLSVSNDRRNTSRKLTTMFKGAMLMLGLTEDRLTQLVERRSMEASQADAATNELRKANTDLLDGVKEKNVTIANLSTDVDKLKETKAEDDSTIANVRRQNADLCERINTYAETSADLRAEVGTLTKVKDQLAERVSFVERSGEFKSQRLMTLGREATDKDDKIKALQDRVAALEAASAKKSSPPIQSQTQTPPARSVGLAAWNNFNVADAQHRAGLRREAAARAAEDAKKGITHDLVEPTFTTSFKRVTIGANGERKVLRAVKDGADTTGTADSGAAAELPRSAPPSQPPASPLPSTTTPTAAGPPHASIADRAQPVTPKTPTAGPSTAAAKKGVCKDFQKKGSCRFGDKCHFAHVPGPVNDNDADKAQAGTPRTKNIPRKNIMCPYLKKEGGCHYGNKCRFAHVATDETVSSDGLNDSGHVPKLNKASK